MLERKTGLDEGGLLLRWKKMTTTLSTKYSQIIRTKVDPETRLRMKALHSRRRLVHRRRQREVMNRKRRERDHDQRMRPLVMMLDLRPVDQVTRHRSPSPELRTLNRFFSHLSTRCKRKAKKDQCDFRYVGLPCAKLLTRDTDNNHLKTGDTSCFLGHIDTFL